MDPLKYINKMIEMYEGPRITAQEPRIGLQGGQLVQPGPGRQGYGGPPVYTINEENFKLLDDLIPNTELTINEIKVKLGGNEKSGNQGINKLIDAWAASDKDRVVSEKRFRPYKMEGTELSQKIINASQDVKYIKKDGTPNIKKIAKDFFPEKKLDDARKMVRSILVAGIDYEGKKNIPGEITSAKQAKKNAYENIKIANKKAGIETTKQADQVIDKILSQNEIYQKMSVEDIAKDKNLLKRLRVQIDPVTGNVTFDGYTKKSPVRGKVFSDLELAQHAKNKADTYELFTPDHITPKAWRKQNVGYPINFQSATYMENSQLDNGRRYLMNNPDGNIKPIDNYLKSQNQTIRFGKNKYGFKLPIVFNSKTGTSNIVELSVKKTIPKATKIPPSYGVSSLGAAGLDDLFKSPAAKKIGTIARKTLLSDWVWPEVLIGALDKQNMIQKGMSEKRASSEMWKNITLGLYDKEGTENAILEQAKKLGYGEKDIRALENLMRYSKLGRDIKGAQQTLKSMELGAAEQGSEEGAQAMKEKIENLKKTQDSVAGFYMGAIGDKDATYGLDIYDQASKELMRTEWNRSLEGRKKQFDPYAGKIGNVLNREIFTLNAPEREALQKQIDAMSPQERDKWNLQERGIGYERVHPMYGAAMSYKQMEPLYDQIGYMYSDGGLANLTRTVAPDSGPMQGLASTPEYDTYRKEYKWQT
jgi:hypothetical protein